MPASNNLPSLLLSHSSHRPALHLQRAGLPDLTITYADLLHHSLAYAQAYARANLLPGEVIILVLQHSPELIYSFFGALLHGAIPSILPFLTEKLSPQRYAEDMAALISITRPAAILTYPDFYPTVASLQTPTSPVRAILQTSQVAAPTPEPDLASLPGLHRLPADIALLQHSSGTTGLQKGVALSHQAVLNQLSAYTASLRLTPHDVVVSWLPLYHDMGLIAGFILPILSGIPLVLLSPFDWVRNPVRLLQAVSTYRGSLSWLPNFAFNFCAQKIRDRDLHGLDLSSWRAVINCSEPVRWESHQLFLQRLTPHGLQPTALAACYAMAENVFAVTQTPLQSPPRHDDVDSHAWSTQNLAIPSHEQPSTRFLSSGPPLPNVQLKILNSSHHPLPDRHIGEIALRSDCMLTAYFNRPDLAPQTFTPDGWYLTGDLGYLLDGEIFVIGRKKDLIIVGGRNIYPQDLELLASQVPGVHPGRVAAFGLYNPHTGTEDIVMLIETSAPTPAAQQAIADHVRQHVTQNSAVALRRLLPVPPGWIIKTSSGKTARSANRDKYLAEFDDHTH